MPDHATGYRNHRISKLSPQPYISSSPSFLFLFFFFFPPFLSRSFHFLPPPCFFPLSKDSIDIIVGLSEETLLLERRNRLVYIHKRPLLPTFSYDCRKKRGGGGGAKDGQTLIAIGGISQARRRRNICMLPRLRLAIRECRFQ